MHQGAREGHFIGLGCRPAAPYMLVSAAILAHPSGLGRACPFSFFISASPYRLVCLAFSGICLGLSAGLLLLACLQDFTALLSFCLLDFAAPSVLVSSTLPLTSLCGHVNLKGSRLDVC